MSGHLRYFCDNARHLICLPYTKANLHTMAQDLGIKRCWYHASPRHPHYDIPKRQIERIMNDPRVTVVSPRGILRLMKGEKPDV